MSTQTYTGTLAVEICASCGMAFGMPTDVQHRRRDDHALFYCPDGHQQQYTGLSDREKAERDLVRERAAHDQTRASRDYALAERDSQCRRVSALSGVIARTKNRIAVGVCPCCKRTFKQLASHMADKHPSYAEERKP